MDTVATASAKAENYEFQLPNQHRESYRLRDADKADRERDRLDMVVAGMGVGKKGVGGRKGRRVVVKADQLETGTRPRNTYKSS